MIKRACQNQIADVSGRMPAMVILGPRQVGKTTPALAITEDIGSVYIDLEQPGDLQKLEDPGYYFDQHPKNFRHCCRDRRFETPTKK